jgi:hypothetical protein
VNLGSQRISREVVSCEAMLKDEVEVRRVVLVVLALAVVGGWEGRAWWLLLIGCCVVIYKVGGLERWVWSKDGLLIGGCAAFGCEIQTASRCDWRLRWF